jgi:hypothetical protein
VKTVQAFKLSRPITPTTRCNIPEDLNLQIKIALLTSLMGRAFLSACYLTMLLVAEIIQQRLRTNEYVWNTGRMITTVGTQNTRGENLSQWHLSTADSTQTGLTTEHGPPRLITWTMTWSHILLYSIRTGALKLSIWNVGFESLISFSFQQVLGLHPGCVPVEVGVYKKGIFSA